MKYILTIHLNNINYKHARHVYIFILLKQQDLLHADILFKYVHVINDLISENDSFLGKFGNFKMLCVSVSHFQHLFIT